MATCERHKITPPELARRWGVSSDKINFFILTGELRAIDASLKRGDRPRYLIDLADVQAFEAAREVIPAVKPAKRVKNVPACFKRHFRGGEDEGQTSSGEEENEGALDRLLPRTRSRC